MASEFNKSENINISEDELEKLKRLYETARALGVSEQEMVKEQTAPEMAPKNPISALGDAMDWEDKHVANRARSAIKAALERKNPIKAAIENEHVDMAPLGEAALKALEKGGLPISRLPKLDESGKMVGYEYPGAAPTGLAIDAVSDPLNYIAELGKIGKYFKGIPK